VHRADPAVPGEARHHLTGDQVDAVVPVQLGAGRGEVGAQYPAERDRVRLDHGDLDAQVAGGGRHLGADEATADHDEPATADQVAAQRDRVVQCAQGVHPAEVRAGQGPRPRAGGHHDAVGRHIPPRRQHDGGAATIQPGRRFPETPLQIEIRVVGRRQREVVHVDLAGQELLRERRAVVGEPVLRPDHHDPPVVALLPQGARGAEPGERAADDRDGAHQAAASTAAGTRT
jgi:hypothetical protein